MNIVLDVIKTDCTAHNINFDTLHLGNRYDYGGPVTTHNTEPTRPGPEEVIQFYRGSTFAIALTGYNNTSVFQDPPDSNAQPVPLPTSMDWTAFNCLNETIGKYVPLMDDAFGTHPDVKLIQLLAATTALMITMLTVPMF